MATGAFFRVFIVFSQSDVKALAMWRYSSAETELSSKENAENIFVTRHIANAMLGDGVCLLCFDFVIRCHFQ